MRTIVDLSDEQIGALARLCDEHKISRAEAVRRAVDHMINNSREVRKDAGFGIWKNKPVDSRKFVEKLRNEWKER